MAKSKKAENLSTAGMALQMIRQKQENAARIEELFHNAKDARRVEREKVWRLLEQAPAAQTMSPLLSKEASVARNVTEFFEKKAFLTEAQRRFPELLKAAGTETTPKIAPSLKKLPVANSVPTGPTPAPSLLSGG